MVNVHCATSACVIWFISMPELPRVAVLLSKRLPTCDTWRQSFCQMLAPFCATFSLKYDVLVAPAQKHNATCQQGEFAAKIGKQSLGDLSLHPAGSLQCAYLPRFILAPYD